MTTTAPSMFSDLQARFDRIEVQRNTICNRVGTLSDTQRSWQPNRSVWSLLQTVEHLVLSDESMGRIPQPGSVSEEMTGVGALPRSWRFSMIVCALHRSIVLPLPSANIVPHGKTLLPDLLQRWQAVRDTMRCELEKSSVGERLYSHPVIGKMSAAEMLTLEETHTAYHARKMDRLRQSAAFPDR